MTDKKIKFKDILKQKLTVHERKLIYYRVLIVASGIIGLIFLGIGLIEILGAFYYNQEFEPSASHLIGFVSLALTFFWVFCANNEQKIAINEFLQSGRQEKVSDQESNKKD